MSLHDRFVELGLADHSIRTYESRLAVTRRDVDLPRRGADEATLKRFRDALRPIFLDAPMGTALPTRAALWHHLVGEVGLDAHEAKKYLPRIRKVDAKTRRDPTPEERRALLEALVGYPPVIPPTSTARQAILLLAETGLRLSEVLGLRWQDVEHVANASCYKLTVRAKRDKILDAFATGLSAEMIRWLGLDPIRSKCTYMFPGRKAGRSLHENAVANELKRIQARSDELDGLHPHLLRHWYAFDALEAGVDVLELQAALGHESPETTAIYARPSQSRRIAAARRTTDAMWGSPVR